MASPKVDLSEFLKLSKPKRKPCVVGAARDQLSTDEQQQLDAAVEAGSKLITVKAIEHWFAARDHKVSHSAIVVHRQKRCACRDD